MRLRSHLLLLALASAAPVMVLAIVIAVLVVRQERDTVRDAAGDRVVAVMAKARAVVERQTRQMARLVGDLLDISRVAMGKVQLERERFNMAEVIGNVIHVWRGSGRLERHQVTLQAADTWVDADRARIEQIVSNLLDNAVKFTPAGRRIDISVQAEGESALLSVADQGEGLAPGMRERLFDLFVQGERGLDRSAGGLGVGLARQMLHEVLELSGHVVREARDGASGLAAAGEARPDIDGYEVARRLRAAPERLKQVMAGLA